MPKTVSRRRQQKQERHQQEREEASKAPQKTRTTDGKHGNWHHVVLRRHEYPELLKWSLACLADALGQPLVWPEEGVVHTRWRRSHGPKTFGEVSSEDLQCKVCMLNKGGGQFAVKLLFEDQNKQAFGYSYRESSDYWSKPPPRYQLDVTRRLLLRREESWTEVSHRRYATLYSSNSEPLGPTAMLLLTADDILMPFVCSVAAPLPFAGALAEVLFEAGRLLVKYKKQRQAFPIDDRYFFLRFLLLPPQLRKIVASFLPQECQREVVAIRKTFEGVRFWRPVTP